MARKNPAAVALGRRGGKAGTKAQAAARAANGRKRMPMLLPCLRCGRETRERDSSRRAWCGCA